MLSSEWETYHRREFTKAISENFISWSDTVAVQYPVSIFFNLFLKFKKRLLPFILGKSATKKIESNILLYTPFVLFHHKIWVKSKIAAFIDSFVLNLQLTAFVKKRLPGQKIILWVYFPQIYYVLKYVKFNYLIYDMYDDNERNYDGKLNNKLRILNRKLIDLADLTICLAKSTFSKLSTSTEKVVYFPNSINTKLFNKHPGKNNENILSFNKKVIGYLGTIRNWIDFELLKLILETFPSEKLVLIGYVNRNALEEFNNLKKFSNFVHINHVSQEMTPLYLSKFDVGIIPFKINEFTASVFPNKFFEYMAAKIPVVTTSLPELYEYRNYCGYSETHEKFIDYLKYAISGKGIHFQTDYEKILEENTWDNKIKILTNEFRNRLKLEI